MKLGLRTPLRSRPPRVGTQPPSSASDRSPPGRIEDHFDFSAGRAMQVVKHLVGQEEQPILVVDGLLSNPASVIDFAESQVIYVPGPELTYYPGTRGRGSDAYVETFTKQLDGAVRETFKLRSNVQLSFESMFSLTVTPASKLRPLQKVPHVDNVGPRGIAGVHFLFDRSLGGTGFFRHKATGWETLNDERAERYNRIVARELEESGSPGGYLCGDTDYFERVFNVEPAMDRLVIFAGHQLHSATIPEGVELPNDVRAGRLTLNSFINLS